MRYFQFFIQTCMVFLLLMGCSSSDQFVLVDSNNQKKIFISDEEPPFVHIAVDDLIRDVEKITGKRLEKTNSLKNCTGGCVIIGSMNQPISGVIYSRIPDFAKLDGKWEAYKVGKSENDLIIAGSDERGTMFGIYHFIEKYLEVDPLYFWKDREPEKKDVLSWENIKISQDEPSFRYRGWFINDEDLLTEWMNGGGARNIDYRYYSQVVHPDVMERLVEAMVRLRFNTIIPASFIDIKNPPERKLVDIAASRGVFLSMHHIEPLGVSGYTFFNYWKDRGKDYKFSYYSHPEELKEVWTAYAKDWAQYDNVIWQIGLRGVADRPMWREDENIPQSDAERGKLISDAMAEQVKIIHSVVDRDDIPMTTTLWMEGSELNNNGHLTFPEDVMVIFSDNSPGWVMQEDFFKTEREPDRKYGIYYHHQLWSPGPHLAQGVPPSKIYEIMNLAKEYDSDEYVMMNVSNIRPFVLGLQASGKMLQNFNQFDPEVFMEEWCNDNFSMAPDRAKAAYQHYFASYQMHDETDMPILLDGQIKIKGLGLLRGLKKRIEEGSVSYEPAKSMDWANQYLGDSRSGNMRFYELEDKIERQKKELKETGQLIDSALIKLDGWKKYFFEVNLVSLHKILLGLTTWLDAVVQAVKAYEADGDKEQCVEWLEKSVDSFDTIRDGQALNTRGEKWEQWYRGEKKMNLPDMEKSTKEDVGAVFNRLNPGE